MDIAKIFWTGRSQAVRLPKEFRFDVEAVRIRRHGKSVILEPVAKNWAWLDAMVGAFDSDAAQTAAEQPELQHRPAVDRLFE